MISTPNKYSIDKFLLDIDQQLVKNHLNYMNFHRDNLSTLYWKCFKTLGRNKYNGKNPGPNL